MKKRFITMMFTSVLVMVILVGCDKAETMDTNNTTIETEVVTESIETAVEEPHEHTYVEEVTTPVTCIEAGEKILTCECGDTHTEVIPEMGHDFSNYVSNEDATYEADGTETATCVCGEIDTRVAEGSMLTYSFEDMDVTKYAKSTVNVRSLPTSDGENLGGLSINDEVKVTGKCNETGWYRIEYSGSIAYVSDEYLLDEKVEVQARETTQNGGSKASAFNVDRTFEEALAYASTKYPMYQLIDNGDGTCSIYSIHGHGPEFPANAPDAYEIMGAEMRARGCSGYSTTGDRVEMLYGADGHGQWSIMFQIVTFS